MYLRIRELREDKNMTQIEMAKLLHCSQRVYSDYECGKVDVPLSILICLADIHLTSVDYLLGDRASGILFEAFKNIYHTSSLFDFKIMRFSTPQK